MFERTEPAENQPAARPPKTYPILSQDREILDRIFTVADPRSIPGLRPNPPQRTELNYQLEYQYDITPPSTNRNEPLVRCAHCQRTNHWRGYVVLYDDGSRVLIGRNCGAAHYGADFQHMERSFNRQRVRQRQIQALRNIRSDLQELNAHFSPHLFDDLIAAYRRTHIQFANSFPKLFSLLQSVVSGNQGELIYEEQVRDILNEDYSSHEPLYKAETRSLGRVEGQEIFKISDSVIRARLVDVCREFGRIARELNECEERQQWPNNIRTLTKPLRNAIEGVELARHALLAPRIFFRHANLRTIVEWLRKHKNEEHVDVDGDALVRRQGDQSVRFQPEFAMLPEAFPIMSRLRSQLRLM